MSIIENIFLVKIRLPLLLLQPPLLLLFLLEDTLHFSVTMVTRFPPVTGDQRPFSSIFMKRHGFNSHFLSQHLLGVPSIVFVVVMASCKRNNGGGISVRPYFP